MPHNKSIRFVRKKRAPETKLLRIFVPLIEALEDYSAIGSVIVNRAPASVFSASMVPPMSRMMP